MWTLDNQDARRNSHTIDKIKMQEQREEIMKRLAKENQRAAGGDRTSAVGKIAKSAIQLNSELWTADQNRKIDTRKECAAAAGIGERTYDAGKLMLEYFTP